MHVYMGYPDSSVGKESACIAGDPGSILGSGRSAGEGIEYSCQYSRASLVPQLVKNPPAMRKTRVQSLGWGDPLEEGKTTHSSILGWKILGLYGPWGHKESDTTERPSFSYVFLLGSEMHPLFFSPSWLLSIFRVFFMAPKNFRIVYFCKKRFWNFDWYCGCMNI